MKTLQPLHNIHSPETGSKRDWINTEKKLNYNLNYTHPTIKQA